MDSQNSKFNVLIVGATGHLGSYITKHCLTKPNLITNIVVRDPQKNKELTSQVEQAGGKVIIADVTKPETLKGVTKGMHTVLCSLSFETTVVIDGQKALIDDCVANGVERFIPTEYSENMDAFTLEEVSRPVADKFEVRRYLESKPIKTLRLDGSLFIESFYTMLAEGFSYWGDSNHRIQMTSYEDTARFIAAAIAKKDQAGHLVFVANEASVIEAAEIYNRVRGTNFVPKRLGSLEDLKAIAKEHEKNNDPFAWLSKFKSLLFDPRIRFDKINNSEFPELKGATIEEFLKQNPEVKVPV